MRTAAHVADGLVTGLQLIGLDEVRFLQQGLTTRVKVAILDDSFAGLPEGFPEVRFAGLPRPKPVHRTPPRVAGHGTRMAGIVQEALGAGVELGLYRMVPVEEDDHSSWIAPADMALTLAHAIGEWGAGVVLVAMGDGMWGTPGYLREVLREARRAGRDGRGSVIVAAVGDASWNHNQGQGSSFAQGADELHAQPWVIAAGATDVAGQWHRRFDRPESFPTGRFGPSLALCAPGEAYRIELLDGAAADDTSGAAALIAASAAAVLRMSPALDADELRAVLQWSADVPPGVDGGAGAAADDFNEWDRLGHNPKLGAGRVNALAAVMTAADPVCAALLLTRPRPGRVPIRGAAHAHPAFLRALSWYWWTRTVKLEGQARELLAGYRQEVAPVLARVFLHSWRWREPVMWLARHLNALSTTQEPWLDAQGRRDHGALRRRVQHALDALREELEGPVFHAEREAVLPWLDGVDGFLRDKTGQQIQRFLFNGRSPFEPVIWARSAPRPLPLVFPEHQQEGQKT